MYQTKVTHSLKNLFARYHEPPALSETQSQKILNSLKTSFRDQLDLEYGTSHAPNRPRSPSKSAPQGHQRQDEAPVRRPAAQRHLKTLLSNPLFSYQQKPATYILPPTGAPRDPLDVFDHAVSKGLMTLQAATGILIAKREQLQSNGADSSTLASARVSRRVIGWLRSSGSDSTLAFLENRAFVRELMPFLVNEGLEEVAWEWLARLLSPTHVTMSMETRRNHTSTLLTRLVRLKSQPQDKGLDSAMLALVHARDTFSSSPLLPDLLLAPWRALSWLTTVKSYTHSKPSLGAFDAHMETSERLDSPVEIEKAHLCLYHPTKSDPAPALQLLKDRQLLTRFASSTYGQSMTKASDELSWLVALGNDTVNYLARVGRKDEARELVGILQRHAIQP